MKTSFVIAGLALLVGCDTSMDPEDDAGSDDPDVVRAVIGPDGGVLAGHGVTLDVPAGALADATELSLRVVDEPAAVGVEPVSPVLRFEPAGTTFAEPVHVAMEFDGDAFATLYWSVPGDDASFEAIGVGAAGLAQAWTSHFSLGFVGNGACDADASEPTTTRCACRAGDEVGDLLCPDDPTDNGGQCSDINGHMGSDGGGCSGYGPRDMLMYQCYCQSGDGDWLCPDAHVFEPQQQCPTEGGLHGYYVEEPMGSCSGTTVVSNPETGESMNASKSGMLMDCNEYAESTEFESVSGTLEGCYVTSEAGDGTCPIGDNAPPQPAVSGECQDLVATLEKRRKDAGVARTACVDPPNAMIAGTEIGRRLELEHFANGTTRLSQVMVPWGSKSECKEKAGDRSTSGYLDLVEIVSRDEATKTVTIRIAEIKPMTGSGLAAGREDLNCYYDRVVDAGKRCKDTKDDGSSLTEYVTFCNRFGAIGWTVKLAEPTPTNPEGWKLRWSPGMTFPHKFNAAPGDTREVMALVCEDGITAYQCVEM